MTTDDNEPLDPLDPRSDAVGDDPLLLAVVQLAVDVTNTWRHDREWRAASQLTTIMMQMATMLNETFNQWQEERPGEIQPHDIHIAMVNVWATAIHTVLFNALNPYNPRNANPKDLWR